MHEIDLIPGDYRQARQLRRWLAQAGLVAALLVALTLAARLALDARLAQARPLVARLQDEAREAGSQRSELLALAQRQAALQARLDALQALREPSGWRAALHSIDQAFDAGLWFDQLRFTQRFVPAAAPPAGTPAPAAAAPPAAPASAWPAERRLEIKGHAADHPGVMGFIARLREQPVLQGVRLVDTGVRRYPGAEVIDFSVASEVAAPPALPGEARP